MTRFSTKKLVAAWLVLSQIGLFVIPLNTLEVLAAPLTLVQQLEGKSASEKVQIKSKEIAKIGSIKKTTNTEYGVAIEVQSVKEISGGVEVLARAWDKNNDPIGFLDGTVEIERFRIFNPPILASNGTFDDYEWENKTTGEKFSSTKPHFVEDPELALIQSLAHTITLVGKPGDKIVKGKTGNTTDTYYPDADPESTSSDGYATQLYGAGSGVSWSTLVSDAGYNGRANELEDTAAGFRTDTGTDLWRGIERGYYLFDTSALPDSDTLSSVTFSIYGATKQDNIGLGSAFDINIFSSAPAANTDIVAGDYDAVGTTAYSTAITYPNFSNTGYNNFAFNATGIAATSKTGVSKFSTREATHDAGNSAPTWASGGNKLTFLNALMAETSGTTSDPKLVIAHSAGGGGGTPPSVSVIQDLTYTYDNNGNITQIVDASDTDTSKTATYTYDDLNRLITAGITNASSGVSYTHTYNYDAIGNITTSTPAGIYVYGSSTYANPHAATSVSSTIYSYDNNGNLTSDSIWTHTWDYRNRLTQSTKTGATSTYTYDHTTSRVKLVTASSTTMIPSQYYSTEAGTAVKYVMGNGMLLATIRGTGASSSLYAMHSDHLGNVEKTTNASGSIVEISDYFPFGSLRNNTQYSFNDRKGFLGKDYDGDTGLTQADARYYTGSIARFISQDSAFWQLPKDILGDPQQLNSYGYARNNPITYKDADGKRVEIIAKAIEANALGTHVFLLMTPDNPSDFGLQSGANWTVGAYAGDNGNLMKMMNALSDRGVVDRGYSVSPTVGYLKQQAEVRRPDGLTDTEFINRIMGGYDAYGDDARYDPFARNGYNSNNFVSGLLINSGAQLPWNGNARGVDPGYGQVIPSNHIQANGQMAPSGLGAASSYAGQQGSQATLGAIQRALQGIQSALNKISNALNSLSKK